MNYSYLIKNQNPVSDSNIECEFEWNVNGPHYLYFLLLVNQYTFFAISCIFTKVTEHRCAMSGDRCAMCIERMTEENVIYKQNVSRSIGHILYPLFVWFLQHNHYYSWFTTSMLLMVIAAMSSQITNLLYLISPGKIMYLVFYHES